MPIKELEYPFDSDFILKKAKSLKKKLMEQPIPYLQKKIAILGGSTTHDIRKVLDLFLLNYGIQAEFYESEYAMYWQDAMFDNPKLEAFAPDLIYIHTTNKNIEQYPKMGDSLADVEESLNQMFAHFSVMWDKLKETYHCPIIQNNMELPYYRKLGNLDAVDCHGRISFIQELNYRFYQYAREQEHFYINDILYLSSCYGLDQWSNPLYWHMYKYALSLSAIPMLSMNVASIIKSILGKNKKAYVLDLDNTLWGGIVGDDGVENLEIGQETSMGQVYLEFQEYLKEQKELGILLNVCSKNEHENALAGLNHPEGCLRPEDFILFKANWEPKNQNIIAIAKELNLLPDSLVFVDDNPAEREIVTQSIDGIAVPEMIAPEQYIHILDRSAYFEPTTISEDDKKRNEMYQANIARSTMQNKFLDYAQYLESLQMTAVIKPFEPLYLARIAQLTNKSNQFNLTTKRYTQAEIERCSTDQNYITLYGKLEDKFGDNGVVSVAIGRIEGDILQIELWIMSCRVLKRDMEFAMMDTLVSRCKEYGIATIKGYYYPTSKNAMVKNFYAIQGFLKEKEDENGNAIWYYEIDVNYEQKNKVIKVVE